MIGRKSSKKEVKEDVGPKGFDDFELRLGDVMRGERATLGKSLLDVQRELRIKAAYIAAIENCDPDAFDTPGFIAGYVRSYARYLGMDPDKCFAEFCEESGFQVAHGMAAEASVVHKTPRGEARKPAREGRDMFAAPKTPYLPSKEAMFSGIEPRAIGSVFVLLTLIAGIGYGGWSVLQEVQRVQVAPVDQTPVVLSDIDPVAGATRDSAGLTTAIEDPVVDAERAAALDRLYRPQALETPVLVPRDAPIATLDPRENGAFAELRTRSPALPVTDTRDPRELVGPVAPASALAAGRVPRVVEEPGPTLRIVAAYPSWVRIRSGEGNILYEGIMEAGDTWDVPETEVPSTLRAGESGAIYFAMGTECHGPLGQRGVVTSGLSLDRDALGTTLAVVSPADDESALNRMFANMAEIDPGRLSKLPCQTN